MVLHIQAKHKIYSFGGKWRDLDYTKPRFRIFGLVFWY